MMKAFSIALLLAGCARHAPPAGSEPLPIDTVGLGHVTPADFVHHPETCRTEWSRRADPEMPSYVCRDGDAFITITVRSDASIADIDIVSTSQKDLSVRLDQIAPLLTAEIVARLRPTLSLELQPGPEVRRSSFIAATSRITGALGSFPVEERVMFQVDWLDQATAETNGR